MLVSVEYSCIDFNTIKRTERESLTVVQRRLSGRLGTDPCALVELPCIASGESSAPRRRRRRGPYASHWMGSSHGMGSTTTPRNGLRFSGTEATHRSRSVGRGLPADLCLCTRYLARTSGRLTSSCLAIRRLAMVGTRLGPGHPHGPHRTRRRSARW
jgi:hypothetical protein